MRRVGCFLILAIFIITVFEYKLLDFDNSSSNESFLVKKINNGHKLCVLFPFRDRWPELNLTAPALKKFLASQEVCNIEFLVLNQIDSFRFNRGSLINVGWMEGIKLGCDYMAMHDVDIIPLNQHLNYGYPENGYVVHLTPGKYHPIRRYDYETYIGGVLLLTLRDFERLNGMSNDFWGWGLEDDEFYLRIRDQNLTIVRPSDLTTNRSNTFRHIHGAERRRDYQPRARKKKRKRDKSGGLSSLAYKVRRKYAVTLLHDLKIVVVDVELFCNTVITPLCASQGRS